MDFTITFDGMGELDKSVIKSFIFLESIYKLYTSAKIHISDITGQIFNGIKTGTSVTVKFTDEENTYTNNMSVLSFSKVQGDIGGYAEVTLISSLYFDSEGDTQAYSGTVSQITSQIMTKHFSNYEFIGSTTDDISRYRYQVAESYTDFMKRLLKYGVINQKPVYLYSTAQGIYYLRGISEMISDEPKYLAEPLYAEIANIKSDADSTTNKILMTDYQFINEGQSGCSSITSIFNTTLFKTSTAISTSLESLSNEVKNAQCDNLTPNKIEIYNWNITPDDAAAMAIKKNYEATCRTYLMEATFKNFMMSKLPIGTTTYVLLPYEPTATSSQGASVNCGEGKYLVVESRYIYEDMMYKTSAVLMQVGY